MKNKFLLLFLAFSLMIVIASPAKAVSFRIKAEIPFDFQIGSKRLPKGEYTIETFNEAGGVLIIRSVKKSKAINFTVIRGKMTDKPKSKLVFHRYGEQYFLARIWDGSSDTILKLDKSSAEKKAAKAAKREENPEEIGVPDK